MVGPDGEVLAATSAEEPFVDVDQAAADEAKGSYPRTVVGWPEGPGPVRPRGERLLGSCRACVTPAAS